MLAQDVINVAKFSEVNSLAIKDNTEALIAFLNMGMVELYKKFPIKVTEHIITLQEGVTNYSLPSDFMYPLSVYEEVLINEMYTPRELAINDFDEETGVFFPDYSTVQIPLTSEGVYIAIVYVQKPVPITVDTLNTELVLPETLTEALVNYIGYRAHLGIRGDGQAENNAHFLRFERSCDNARALGVAHPQDSWRMINRISDRGFV